MITSPDEFNVAELQTKLDEKLSAFVVQQQVDHFKEWIDQYLRDVGEGLRALEVDVLELTETTRAGLYQEVAANRFAEKSNDDKLAALRWAVLEEKCKAVRMLISQVLVVKGDNGEKKILPQLAFAIPMEYAILVYIDVPS